MKKHLTPLLLVLVAALAISFTACKSKPKDADIKAAIEKAARPVSLHRAGEVIAANYYGVSVTCTVADAVPPPKVPTHTS